MSFNRAQYANKTNISAPEAKLFWSISLENQQEERPIISKPIEVFYQFYFRDSSKTKTSDHLLTPTIIDLIKFASTMASGIIWKNPRQIIKSNAEKYFSKQEYTSITVTILGRNNEKKPKE